MFSYLLRRYSFLFYRGKVVIFIETRGIRSSFFHSVVHPNNPEGAGTPFAPWSKPYGPLGEILLPIGGTPYERLSAPTL
ncbi:hypothetical protein, partial [Hallella sp.]|uniref:hypothetical protein n=1 Tax=Hallella sp. TaxID=2980186 RepID=UPI0030806609